MAGTRITPIDSSRVAMGQFVPACEGPNVTAVPVPAKTRLLAHHITAASTGMAASA